MKIARVLALLLLASPAFAILRGTAERELMPRQLDIAQSGQTDGRIATDGTSFFSVWTDGSPGGYDILGARLAQDGAVVDAVPLAVANTPASENEPTVAWGRDRYLTVWMSDNERVRGRFVSSVGTMSDIIDIGTRVGTGIMTRPKVAFDGRVFLVAWNQFNPDTTSIRAAIVDLDGHVLITREILRPANDGVFAAMGGTFYFVHVDAKRVLVTPLDEALNSGDTILLEDSPHPAGGIRVAVRGDEMLIAWTGSSPAKYIQTVRLTRGGGQERRAFDSEPSSLQEVVTDGDGYLLVYGDFSSVRARRPGSDSETLVAIPPGLPATVDSAASNGSHTVALIRTTTNVTNGDLWTSVIGGNTAAALVVAPHHQTTPEVATAGDLKLVVWTEFVEDRIIVAGARVDANGTPLDSPPIEIGSFTTFEPRHPRVASNGTGWLVIWQYQGAILGRRIRRNGTFLDDTPLNLGTSAITFTSSEDHTAVAWDGTSYVVAFTAGLIGRFVNTYTSITRVPSTGNPSATFSINAPGQNFNPAIAAGPDAALVVWTTASQVRGALVSHNDAVTPVAFPFGTAYAPSVAWNRDAFLVAVSPVTFSKFRELRWARVDPFGNALESFSTIDTPLGLAAPRVVPFGDHFLLLWIQQHLFGAIVDRNGNLIDGPAVIAENIQSFGADAEQVVTSRVSAHPTRPSRIFLQSIEWTPETVRRMRSVRH
jgi:hypothetical protein